MSLTFSLKRHLPRLLLGVTIGIACASAGNAQNQPWKSPLSNQEMARLVDYLKRIGASCIKSDPECAKGFGSTRLVPVQNDDPCTLPPALWGVGASGDVEFIAGAGLAFCDLNPMSCERLRTPIEPTSNTSGGGGPRAVCR